MTLLQLGAGEDRAPRPVPEGRSAGERFLRLIDRPRVPLRWTEQPVKNDRFHESSFAFNSERDERVPGLMLKPLGAEGRLPVVVVLHGTGGSKEGMRPWLEKFAGRGMIAVAIDGRFSGERAGGQPGSAAYQNALFETWKTGKGYPFLYDTAWDLMRLIDGLTARPDVDPNRIGAIGFSKGGMELFLAAAADSRIRASVPCIGVQSFGWALDHDAWQSRVSTIQSAVDQAARESGQREVDAAFVRRFYARVVPGITAEFDGPAMLPEIAPRPLLVINGERDDRTPGPGLQQCIEAARAAYKRANASENFEFLLQPETGHAVTADAERRAIDWIFRRLSN